VQHLGTTAFSAIAADPAPASASALDFGDYNSATLTGKARAALQSKNYPAVPATQ
jgi:hypothetical protein